MENPTCLAGSRQGWGGRKAFPSLPHGPAPRIGTRDHGSILGPIPRSGPFEARAIPSINRAAHEGCFFKATISVMAAGKMCSCSFAHGHWYLLLSI